MQSRHAPLQVEIRERQGEYWFCKHAGQDIPYSEVPSTDQLDEHGELPVNCTGWITELENTVQGKETQLEHNLLWRVIRLKPQVCTGWITVRPGSMYRITLKTGSLYRFHHSTALLLAGPLSVKIKLHFSKVASPEVDFFSFMILSLSLF